ncbi:bifunctional DNA primase/polymerase [Micromonospora sp. WMMD1274]|uniref:bifunctional DNA primase/polymerase n=1 Tax=Micromonospora sp. WMMD1274 TaxID=3404116 RepID=UPI003B928C4E
MQPDIYPYAAAAPAYRAAGWAGTLHLPAGQKWPPPPGWTGRGAPYPDDADVDRWCRHYPAANIALRLPPTVLGIDVDCWDGKPGAASFASLSAECGPLPPTWATTSRGDGSGIRLYRVPAGVRWQERRAGPGIELLHSGHRYAVVWPSMHPEGRRYRWIGPDVLPADRVPHVAELPALPASWGRRLSEVPVRARQACTQRGGSGPRVGGGYAAASLAGAVAELSALGPGSGRNGYLNRKAFALGGLVAAGLLAEDEVRDSLYRAAVLNGHVDKHGERQTWATIESGMRAGRSRPRTAAVAQ